MHLGLSPCEATSRDRDGVEERIMMGGFGGIGMLVWLGVIVAAIWWITQAASQKAPSAPSAGTSSTPRELLDARLARGEITVEQYRELRQALE